MNKEEEKILNQYFDFRHSVFENDVNSIESIASIINKKVQDVKSRPLQNADVLEISSALLHYRELCGLNRIKPSASVVSPARAVLQQYINIGLSNKEEQENNSVFYSIASYAVAMSFHLFYLGNAGEINRVLIENDGFVEYFDGANLMFKYFEQTKVFNNYCGISNEFLYENIRQEVYGVWSYYQSISYMPLVLFLYFLNSNISFEELEAENKRRLEVAQLPVEVIDEEDQVEKDEEK